MQKDIKKPLLSGDLAVGDNKGLQSADADKHSDRIARFGLLKHRSKLQENYLWSIAGLTRTATQSQSNHISLQNLLTSLVNAVTICCLKIITP